MKILAIETSSDACSAALAIDDDVYEVYRWAPREHTQLILSMVEDVLSEADCGLSQLDAIGFGRGPGAFTGVRVATSVTQGIALKIWPMLDFILRKGFRKYRGIKVDMLGKSIANNVFLEKTGIEYLQYDDFLKLQ